MTDGAWKEKIENLSNELQKYIDDFYFSYREEKLTDTEDDFLQNELEYLVAEVESRLTAYLAEVESRLTAYRFSKFVSEQYYGAGHECPVCDGTLQKWKGALMCNKCGFIVEPYTISNEYYRGERWR